MSAMLCGGVKVSGLSEGRPTSHGMAVRVYFAPRLSTVTAVLRYISLFGWQGNLPFSLARSEAPCLQTSVKKNIVE